MVCRVAAESFQEFYAEVRKHVTDLSLPTRVTALDADHRAALRSALKGRWPAALRYDWEIVGFEIARNSAHHLMERTSSRRDREELLWRLLRLAASPYFVLGTDRQGLPIRYRVLTRGISGIASNAAFRHVGRPCRAADRSLASRGGRSVRLNSEDRRSHVEIRWSHGKFAGVPEAKIYLDTPHHDVAGYEPIDSGN